MSSKYILFWAKLYSVTLRLYEFIYVGRAGHFRGATALSKYPVPSWVPITLSRTHEFPCIWFQKGRQEAKSTPHSPTREKSPRGLEFLMKLKVEQNVCLCQQAGTFGRLIGDGGREWGQDQATVLWASVCSELQGRNTKCSGSKANSQPFLRPAFAGNHSLTGLTSFSNTEVAFQRCWAKGPSKHR